MTKKHVYNSMFKDYPDVLNVEDMSRMLNISVKTVYKLLKDRSVEHLKVGREYRIPKINLIKYLLKSGRA